MFTVVELPGPRQTWEPPPAKPLYEALWHSWVLKGLADDSRSYAAQSRAVKWVSIAGLLATAALWSQFTPYEAVVRFIVAMGAIAVMFHAAVFGALAFNFSGDWQRALVATSAAPFAASLAWGNVRMAHND